MHDLMRALDPLLPLNADSVGLLVLLVTLPFFVVFTWRAQHGRRFGVRRIPVYERLPLLTNQAAEDGRPLQVATGSAGLAGPQAAESLAGLVTLDYVARRAAVWGQPVVGSTADGASLPAAQGLLRQALEQAGLPEQYPASALDYYGPDPLAYAAGTAQSAATHGAGATVLLGRFGVEGLWLAEAGVAADRVQVGGTAEPDAAALLHACLDDAVHGEEVYAVGAYLHRPSHLGSLATQDLLRAGVVIAIVVGVVLASLGILG